MALTFNPFDVVKYIRESRNEKQAGVRPLALRSTEGSTGSFGCMGKDRGNGFRCSVTVRIEDADAHCARDMEHGARITEGPVTHSTATGNTTL